MENIFKINRIICVIFVSQLTFVLAIEYINDTSLDGYMCHANDREFEVHSGVYSTIHCTAICDQKPGCRAIFYQKTPATKCYGCNKMYASPDGLDEEDGTKYYRQAYAMHRETCNDRTLCRPQYNLTCANVDQKCVCIMGYAYDPTRGMCVYIDECVALGDTYQRYYYKAISGFNYQTFNDQNIASCSEKCSSNNWCKSFDFNINNADCFLQQYTAIDIEAAPSLYTSTSYLHFTRNCA